MVELPYLWAWRTRRGEEREKKKRTGMEEEGGWRGRGGIKKNDPILLTRFAIFTYFQHVLL